MKGVHECTIHKATNDSEGNQKRNLIRLSEQSCGSKCFQRSKQNICIYFFLKSQAENKNKNICKDSTDLIF
jgi:hypothetical protein